jgi:hypothetical protein
MAQGFWSDPLVEPKRQYRWVLYLGGMPTWIIKTVKKPSFTVTESPHQYLNHTFYYPARVQWNTIDITLADPVDPDASDSMLARLFAAGYEYPLDAASTTTVSKVKANFALGEVKIVQLGAEGEAVETWSLTNSFITAIDFGTLDYASDEMVNISATIRYDWAELDVPAGRTISPG